RRSTGTLAARTSAHLGSLHVIYRCSTTHTHRSTARHYRAFRSMSTVVRLAPRPARSRSGTPAKRGSAGVGHPEAHPDNAMAATAPIAIFFMRASLQHARYGADELWIQIQHAPRVARR